MLGSLLSSQPPSWVLPGAYIDIDFVNNRSWNGYVAENNTDKGSVMSLSGSGYVGAPYTPQRNGILKKGTTGQHRITDLGYFTERSSTNTCLQCRDLTQAVWNTKTSATVAFDQVGNDDVSVAGSITSASSILATGPNAIVTQSITLTSQIVIGSAYVKRLTGSGVVNMTVDNGATWTPITFNSSGYTWCQIPQQTLANPVFGFQIVTSGDKIAVDFCMLETGGGNALGATDKATTPIVTTTVAVTRGNETGYWGATVQNDGQRIVNDVFSSGIPWTMIASFNGDLIVGTVKGPTFIASDLANPTSLTCGGGSVGFGNNFPNKTSSICNLGRGNWNIGAFTCNGLGSLSCANGGAPSAINSGVNTTPVRNAATWVSTSLTANLAAIIAVTNGNWKVTVNGVAQNLSGLNFTSCTTLPQVAAILQAALSDCIVTATASVLTITVFGAGTTVAVATFAGGTDMNGASLFAGASGTTTPAGTHFNIFNNGAGTSGCPLNGSVGRVAFFKGELDAARLQLYTDLTGPFATFN